MAESNTYTTQNHHRTFPDFFSVVGEGVRPESQSRQGGVYSPAGGLAHELVSAVVLGDARNVRDVAARIVGALH